MLVRLSRFVTRRPRRILAVAGLVLVVAAIFGVRAPAKLESAGFTSPHAPSQIAADRLAADFGGSPNLVFLVEARSGGVDSPAVVRAGETLAAGLARSRDVTAVSSYWPARVPALRSRDGRDALVLATVTGSDTAVTSRAKALAAEFGVPAGGAGPVTVLAGGGAGISSAITDQISSDLATAEGLAIPITAVLLILAFGSVLAALLPVALGVISIFLTLFALWVLASVTDVSIYAVNLTTALGLGLGIDYALLMVNRYREELAAGADPQAAVHLAMARAGRTIIFSAATVAAALGALLVFPVYFLRSFAYAGISVVALSALAALVVLPALLSVLGRRVNAWALPWARAGLGRAESRFWGSVATRVMARPVTAALPVVAVLVLVGTPFLHVRFGTPDDRVLPTSAPARQVGDALRASFAADTDDTIEVVTARRAGPAATVDYSRRLSSLPGVASLQGPAGTWVGGRLVARPAADAGYQVTGASWFHAVITPDPLSATAARLVGQVRALAPPAGTTTAVGGFAASMVDQKHDLGSRLPLALVLIVLTTFCLLFAFTGSVVLPLKALVLNALNLTAVFGVVVWIFQEGHLSGLLGFTPTPTSTSMPILLFCIAFGLSMDYEVFLLSRIKELHDAGATNEESVAGGLARTGRIVSTAAGILAVTFFAFGLSKVSFIQLFGIGTALAILVDATVIRGVLVPAFMRLAGAANWWAPAPLRRLHRRIGLEEGPTAPTGLPEGFGPAVVPAPR